MITDKNVVPMQYSTDEIIERLRTHYPPTKDVLRAAAVALEYRAVNARAWATVLSETRRNALQDARQQVYGTTWGSRTRIDQLIKDEEKR